MSSPWCQRDVARAPRRTCRRRPSRRRPGRRSGPPSDAAARSGPGRSEAASAPSAALSSCWLLRPAGRPGRRRPLRRRLRGRRRRRRDGLGGARSRPRSRSGSRFRRAGRRDRRSGGCRARRRCRATPCAPPPRCSARRRPVPSEIVPQLPSGCRTTAEPPMPLTPVPVKSPGRRRPRPRSRSPSPSTRRDRDLAAEERDAGDLRRRGGGRRRRALVADALRRDRAARDDRAVVGVREAAVDVDGVVRRRDVALGDARLARER